MYFTGKYKFIDATKAALDFGILIFRYLVLEPTPPQMLRHSATCQGTIRDRVTR